MSTICKLIEQLNHNSTIMKAMQSMHKERYLGNLSPAVLIRSRHPKAYRSSP